MSLDSATLIKKAKAATKTGFLTEELPPPTGYVAGKHPIRPGASSDRLLAGWCQQEQYTGLTHSQARTPCPRMVLPAADTAA
jgi:hypothetical protein